MGPVERQEENEIPEPDHITVQGKVTGIIYPPPDIRAVVDKTAQFVARNGRNFERRLAGETSSTKFSFLKPSDPYHTYYEFKVNEFTEKDFVIEENKKSQENETTDEHSTEHSASAKPLEKSTNAESGSNAGSKNEVIFEKKAVETLTAKVSRKLNEKTVEPPPPELYKIQHPTLSALDQEIMYLTAQYTAHSGKSFLAGLATREQRNPQFDFLKPTHALFAYFTALVESYAQVLSKSKEQMHRIEEGMSRMKVLDRCVHRMEWMRMEHEKQAKEVAESDAERLALAQIDWHDFVVVETIRFNDEEDAQDEKADDAKDELPASDDDMDMEDDSDDEAEKPNIKVVDDYVPLVGKHAAKSVPQSMMTVDGKTISSADANEHMRILLMNPKWREESQRHLEKQKDTSFAAGSAIADSLRRFATKRADIFSSSAEEEAKLLENERKREEKWNQSLENLQEADEMHDANQQSFGHSDAVPYMQTGFPPHMPHSASNVWPPNMPPGGMYPPSISHQAPPGMEARPMQLPPGLGQPLNMMNGPPGAMPMPQPCAPGDMPSLFDENPNAKRLKTDTGSMLLPEDEFAALHPGSLLMSVKVPNDPSCDLWKLEGQSLNVEVDIKDSIRTLKAKLMEQLGMPVNKQQLKTAVGFLKDTLSCAHYNFVNGTSVELSIRQRGGRR